MFLSKHCLNRAKTLVEANGMTWHEPDIYCSADEIFFAWYAEPNAHPGPLFSFQFYVNKYDPGYTRTRGVDRVDSFVCGSVATEDDFVRIWRALYGNV